MTSGRAGRATPRTWARVALAGLVLAAAGLLQVLVGSRGHLLQLVVGTVLSVAVLAATAWWAFTTRRVWKRWLNIVIATLAALNIVLGFLEFGIRQAAGALAITAGALTYATGTRRALRPTGGLWAVGSPDPGDEGLWRAGPRDPGNEGLWRAGPRDPGNEGLWTAGSRDPGVGLPSRLGPPAPDGVGRSRPGGSGRSGEPGDPGGSGGSGELGGPGLGPGGSGWGWLLVNPRSGGGTAGRAGLVEAAGGRGIRVRVLEDGDDPGALAREAVAGGAGVLGVAGGDGSLGPVAAVAVEADVPFVCVPAGTRNHFAGDLGLDRGDPLAALEAFGGPERRIDVGVVGDRVFVNNVSLGAYADLVADPRYRAGKLATAHAVLPASLRGERPLLHVGLRDAEGREHPDVLVLLVSCNPYELDGGRDRLDGGVLQVSALRARTGAAFAGLATRALAGLGRARGGRGWAQWTTTVLRVEAPLPQLPAGIDGEAATVPSPLEFRVLPSALRVRVPPALGPWAPRVRLHRWATIRRLLAVAAGRPDPVS
jgi:diacylglycerol kinase family enzyme